MYDEIIGITGQICPCCNKCFAHLLQLDIEEKENPTVFCESIVSMISVIYFQYSCKCGAQWADVEFGE